MAPPVPVPPIRSDLTPALVIGCGYLGHRVAIAWRSTGRQVFALTRNRTELLTAVGFDAIRGDVLDPTSLMPLPRVATVLYAVGLDRSAGKPMREVYVNGLANVLHALPGCDRWVSISSTSVYGQTDGSIVDESAVTEPLEKSGRIVLEAEALLRDKLPQATILRFAGIYGPNRLLRKQPLLNGEPLIGDAEKWLNLIHVQDGVRAVLCAEATPASAGCIFNIADDTPVRRRDFYAHLAHLLNAPEAKFEPAEPTSLEANRRISNIKARNELGFQPEFPSYEEGLVASLSHKTLTVLG